MAGSLKETVEESDTRLGRLFDFSIQALIVLSLVTFSIETLPHLSPSYQKLLSALELLCVVVFTFEYIVRLWVADRKIAFVFSFFGVIDLIAILPFYLTLGIDLRSVRVFRFLRLFRILKLVRYNQAVRRFHRALLIAREEIVLFAVVALILLYLAAVGIYYFENEAQPEAFASVFHSLWWATATLTTVGYGDVYPVTVGGRCFTFLVLLVGLGIVSVPAGLVASALSKAREIEDGKELFETDTKDCR
ncbi:ion transporter [Novipirellula rosea]|uniref:Ion transporter n=1 Tax=Novipirellula rosea TaxID=1031540 RepID=A0ABP8M2W9_9BACT